MATLSIDLICQGFFFLRYGFTSVFIFLLQCVFNGLPVIFMGSYGFFSFVVLMNSSDRRDDFYNGVGHGWSGSSSLLFDLYSACA